MNGWIGLTIVGRRCSMHKLETVFNTPISDIKRILLDGVWYDVHTIEFYLDSSPYVMLQKRIFFEAALQDDSTSKGKKTKNKSSRKVVGSFDKITMIEAKYS